jgi:flagellin-like protein
MNFGKSIRKFRKNTRAISPVIATLLMIAIAVVASLVTYAWVMGYMNFQTAKTGQAIQIQSMSNSTVTTIPGLTPTAGRLVIYVQNVGDSSVNVNSQSVYVNNALVSTNQTSSTTIPAQSTLTIGTSYSLVTIGTQSANVDVKVTTEGGTFSEVSKTFP